MQRPTWAYVLIAVGAAFAGALALGAAIQFLFFHLDLSNLLGTAVGCSLAIAIVSYGHRVNQQAQKR
ncbi:MAG TPA: hypothetical protein VN847_01795 [Streptosporangiaceae bacterium]|nr:hypothetical protein [Streptosporangiaceae bacterium]